MPRGRVENLFFEKPILNSPYEIPTRHWELDEKGQPTQKILESRRGVSFISPIPQPRNQGGRADQQAIIFDEGKGLSTGKQQYDPTPVINELRHHVALWRDLPNPEHWQV